MRVKLEMEVAAIHQIKKKLLQWADQFEEVIWLDSNAYPNIHNKYQAILAVDADYVFQTDSTEALNELKEYRKTNKDWLFGYLSYDAENPLDKEINKKTDYLEFSKLSFFHPSKIFFIKKDGIELHYSSDKENEIKSDRSEERRVGKESKRRRERNQEEREKKQKQKERQMTN